MSVYFHFTGAPGPGEPGAVFIAEVPESMLTEEDEDILDYDDIDDPEAFA